MQRIGSVLKSNGKDGELLMSFTAVSPEEIDLREPVYIEDDGIPVPYFFESFQKRGNSRALVRLTGVKNLTDADELALRPVFADYFEDDDEDSFFEGWTLIDQDGRTVGTISGREDIPGNLCLSVEIADGDSAGEEVLVPLHEDLIIGADKSTRTLQLTVPDGLL